MGRPAMPAPATPAPAPAEARDDVSNCSSMRTVSTLLASLPSRAHSEACDSIQAAAAIDRICSPAPQDLSRAMHQKMRILEATQHTKRVDMRATLGSLIFGYGSKMEHFVFTLVVRQQVVNSALWALWWAGCMGGLIFLFLDKPLPCGFASCLMLPMPCLNAMVLSLDLTKMLLMQFEFYLVTCFHMYVCWGSVKLLEDSRLLFWVFYMPSVFVASLVDAYPTAYRPFFSRMFFSGMLLVLMSWGGLLWFDNVLRIHDEQVEIFNYHSDLVSSQLTSIATVTAFCIKNVLLTFFRPEQFVLIRSSIRSTVVELEQVALKDSAGQTVYGYKPAAREPQTLAELIALADKKEQLRSNKDQPEQRKVTTRRSSTSVSFEDVVVFCNSDTDRPILKESRPKLPSVNNGSSAASAAADAAPAPARVVEEASNSRLDRPKAEVNDANRRSSCLGPAVIALRSAIC